MPEISVRISTCPICGAPIYAKRLSEDFFRGYNENLFLSPEVYKCDERDLPKNESIKMIKKITNIAGVFVEARVFIWMYSSMVYSPRLSSIMVDAAASNPP